MKKILVINGNPDAESFCFALAARYKKGADAAGAACTLVHLKDLSFNPLLASGYRVVTPLEPDLLAMQRHISEATHLVFVYPNWWGTGPALLKGFMDRVFLPGFAFKYRPNSPFWDKLLVGKTARLIVTMDTPAWYYYFVNGSPGHKAMKNCILEFCGVKPVRISSFGPIKSSDKLQRAGWLMDVETLGKS